MSSKVRVIVDSTLRGGVSLFTQAPVTAAYDAAPGVEPPPRQWLKLSLHRGANDVSQDEIALLERRAYDAGLILCKSNDGLYFLTNGLDGSGRALLPTTSKSTLAFDSRGAVQRALASNLIVSSH